MTVRSEEKSVLDGGAIPPISTKEQYTERDWSRLVGWGNPPRCDMNTFDTGMISFDRANSTQADSPKDD